MNSPGFPISRKRMLDFAHNRAAQDAETGPWTSADVREFEGDFLTAPRMPFYLQVVAMRRLADLQHDLMHADFNQGKVVARLPKEVDVQNWFAHMLRERQGRSYSMEREPHIVEERYQLQNLDFSYETIADPRSDNYPQLPPITPISGISIFTYRAVAPGLQQIGPQSHIYGIVLPPGRECNSGNKSALIDLLNLATQ